MIKLTTSPYETLDELIMSWWDSLTEEIQDEIREFYGDETEAGKYLEEDK